MIFMDIHVGGKIPDETRPSPPDGMGKAGAFTVWAEPAWSPLRGWLGE